jgi:hypothetical protein
MFEKKSKLPILDLYGLSATPGCHFSLEKKLIHQWKEPGYTAILDGDICVAKTLIFTQSSKCFELLRKQHAYYTHNVDA